MEDLSLRHTARQRAGGTKRMAIIGVVASGNLEVLVERVLPDAECAGDKDCGQRLRRSVACRGRRLCRTLFARRAQVFHQ